jgi:predicted RNase H-like HicB family nuclease
MRKRNFDVILEKDEDGWFIADVPALPGCHTQGKTKKEVLENAKEAIALCLEVMEEKKAKKKSPFVSVEKVAVYA